MKFTPTPIGNDAVTDTKLRDSAAVSVIGRAANTAGDPADIAAASNGQFLARLADVVGFVTPAMTHLSDVASGTMAYNAANFTAESGTWTVDNADQVIRYRRNGGILIVSWIINTTAISGTPVYIAFTIPNGYSAAVETRGQCDVRNNGTASSTGMWIATETQIRIYRDQTSTLWSISAGNAYTQGFAIVFI